MNTLLKVIKAAANQCTEESNPSGIYFGEVLSVDPLSVLVEQKLTLTEEFLTLTHDVKDYYVDITVSHYTVNDDFLDPTHRHPKIDSGGTSRDGAGNPNPDPGGDKTDTTYDFDTTHKHAYQGKKKIMLHHGLKEGEQVMLLRAQGGQNYIIIDRVNDPICEGEWIE
ncbi:MAG: DUF2577 domain-containing protein [Clostridium lundense]|nr:DUF2577 domain-containing protein [Clostridium lundense]